MLVGVLAVVIAAFTSRVVLWPMDAIAEGPATMPPPGSPANETPGPPPGKATQQQLEQLVSPIALYPDLLVAQILAASTYPTQIVEADRWLQQNKSLKGQQLTNAVSQQPWDPSVKSLCQYAPVLDNLNQNLSWTSALGEAYYNQPTDVMNAIQTLRKMAMKAGNLKSGPQQTVKVEPAAPAASSSGSTTVVSPSGSTQTIVTQPGSSQTIIIEPTQPQVVYVPQYNPTTAYGQPMAAPQGYSSSDLLMASLLSFGVGMMVGDMIGSSSNNWGCNWHGGNVTYNRNVYVSGNNTFPSRYGYGYRPPYGGNHPYYGYNNGYPRPYTAYGKDQPYGSYRAPTMPKQYNDYGNWDRPVSSQNLARNESQNRPLATNQYRPDEQRSGSSNWNNNAFRGYRDPDSNSSGRSSWGNLGRQQPGGFAQASSWRGRSSYSGGNWRSDGGFGGRRFR